MMKKLMALLLAAALAFGTAATSLAASPPEAQTYDSGVQTETFLEYEITIEELFAQYGEDNGEGISGVASYAAVGNYFGNKLTGNARILYDNWTTYFSAIIENNRGVSRVETPGLSNVTFEDLSASFYAVLKDHPKLLFWLDKTTPTRFYGLTSRITTNFPVITMYRGTQAGVDKAQTATYPYYNVKPSENNRVNAQRVAKEIVTYANSHYTTDFQKIRYFNQRICLLTDYKHEALEPGYPYDDTFQWVDVFNGKKVVCEGYAKAFKYLCDEAGIGCLIVEGALGGAGNHMWNLVQLDNAWYVVDCTNNDIPSELGAYSEILLAIGSGNRVYKDYGFDPLRYVDGDLVELNPEGTLLSVTDYAEKPADAPPPVVSSTVTVQNGTADKTKAEAGDLVTITANAPAAGQKFKEWTGTAGVRFADANAATTTFVMPGSDVTVTASYAPINTGGSTGSTGGSGSSGSSGGSGGGGGGGGGSSGGRASAESAPATPATVEYSITAVASKTQEAVAAAISRALAAKQRTATATVVLENVATLTPEMVKSVLDAARAASTGKGVTVTPVIACDTVENGRVVTRVIIDPAKGTLTGPVLVGGAIGNQPVVEFFAKHFSNTFRAVKLEQAGAFGMPVNVAAKVDFTGMNTKTLCFYSYNQATNLYARITAPAYSIDANGFLRFTTTQGGTILITDHPLTA